MNLFRDEGILTKEIESCKGFTDRLSSEDIKAFLNMLNGCYKYSKAINAKGWPFPTEPVIMTIVFRSTN